ncbi:MAG: M48 family metallopeptidase [Burkholderiales bacterium]|nr:M48 family metallopeptidase [Burkholderiales bacterium]
MLRQIRLAGQDIDYQVKHTRRKTIGLKIDHEGLQVLVPFDFPFESTAIDIGSLLQSKSNWILKKLAKWRNKKLCSRDRIQQSKTAYPLLGDLWKPEIKETGQIHMMPVVGNTETKPSNLESYFTPEQIQKWINAWYQQQAIICFSRRIIFYADKLNVPKPSFKLTQARTRWGSCNSRGIIRLNWRLVQLPQYLVDYVVAHELCHLIEMNHSRRFWKLVATIYPDYQRARAELREY